MITRRTCLAAAASALCSPVVGAWAATGDLPVKTRAARNGILFGAMVDERTLTEDTPYRAAIVEDCAVVVPGIEMKWGFLERRQGMPDYRAADAISQFAREHQMKMRGHTPVWYMNLPKWVVEQFDKAPDANLLYRHVSEVVGHFSGRIAEWDVVNEALEPRDKKDGGFRNSAFYRAAGPQYIAECFHAAHQADPHAALFYNDYALEYATEPQSTRRRATLDLLTQLKKAGVPIHGLGIQCHLTVGNKFSARDLAAFLKEVGALGLKISLTEFDVSDQNLAAEIESRDRMVADHAREFLDVALSEKAVKSVVTWGITDRYTWYNSARPRSDGVLYRSLPLDDQMKRKPLWYAMAASFDAAPAR
jgi:endo-1,4-beta-xylanase